MKKLLLSTVLALGWFATPIAPAHAQQIGCGVNFTPQVGINCANVRTATYVGQILGLVPVTDATDVWCINGSATKTINVRQVQLTGTATTAVDVPVTLIRRNTLDTGTAGTPYITLLNTTNPASTATLVSYTANPTITDSTSHQALRGAQLTMAPGAPPTIVSIPLLFQFGTAVDMYNQGASIQKGQTTQQICINLGATAITAGALWGTVEWTEE